MRRVSSTSGPLRDVTLSSHLVLPEILFGKVFQELLELFRFFLVQFVRLLGEVDVAGLLDDLLVDEDRAVDPQGKRDGVARPRVNDEGVSVSLQVDAGKEGVVPQIDDLDPVDLRLEDLEEVPHQVVSHGPREADLLELRGDGARFEEADPDGHRPLPLQILQDHDGGVCQRVDGQTGHLHFHKHLRIPPVQSSISPRRECKKASTIRTRTVFPTRSLSPVKFTILFVLVRPIMSREVLRLVPSTRTSTVLPTRVSFFSWVCRSWRAWRSMSRLRFSSGFTFPSSSTAAVPFLSEYWNENKVSNLTF